jgi:ABC transport system ATP-binding/permease protein
MPVLDATQLSKHVADRTLFSDVTFTIRRGEKVGLVGHNGSGKSTLGRVLAGIEEPDGGRIARRREATFDYLEQEPRLTAGKTIREVVLESLREWNRTRLRFEELTEALSQTTDPDELTRLAAQQAEVGEALERQGGWEREHEAEATIGHLGLPDASRLVETLSGGEARRTALARLLVAAPDLAILDEPTNHLDVETIEWLEEYLRDRFSGALLLISHDRSVLDHVTTRTLEIHDGSVDSYDGGYATYLIGKADREAQAERTERNRQNFLRREVEWLRRAPKARGTKQKARISRAEEALGREAPKQEQRADLRLRSERQGKTVLEISNLTLERDGRCLISGLDLAIRPGERIGVVGPNGSGKTSLLLALQGQLTPTTGKIVLGANTKIGYLDQARGDLDDRATVREAAVGDATEIIIGEERLTVGSYLERFLFSHRHQRLRVAELSGGERARVCLARLLATRCNLLLLDEPTNDLDVATLSSLEAMLVDFGGSAILVSHDRWLLDRVATSILSFEPEGRVELHIGNYSDFHERRVRRESERKIAKSSVRKPAIARAEKAVPARPKMLSSKERRELDGLPDGIESAEAELGRIQAALADPEIYQGDGHRVAELREELTRAEAEIERLGLRWEELEARDVARS